MALKEDSQTPRRRRGRELDEALLEAAWAELAEVGYTRFTIESVAARAGTSRAVIYRRWATKPELVLAAVGYMGAKGRPAIPDTGTLRGDLIELMRLSNRTRVRLGVTLVLQLADYYAESGTSLADLRERFLPGQGRAVQTIMDRAVARGEVDPERLTPRVVRVPFDLFRQEVLMTFKPASEEAITAIVDEVFLPLVGC